MRLRIVMLIKEFFRGRISPLVIENVQHLCFRWDGVRKDEGCISSSH